MSDMNPQALRHMWQRVILQALRDALGISKVKDTSVEKARREAQAWLESPSGDFGHVCTLAGFDPDVVREWWRAIKDDPSKIEAAGRFLREAAVRKEAKENEDAE